MASSRTNEVDFDWLLPRFHHKLNQWGIEAKDQQAALAFYHLTNDLFWMIAYKDPTDRFREFEYFTLANPGKNIFCNFERNRFGGLAEDMHIARQLLDCIHRKWLPSKASARPRFWWVNQGKTFDAEHQESIVWAPQIDKTRNHSVSLGKRKSR